MENNKLRQHIRHMETEMTNIMKEKQGTRQGKCESCEKQRILKTQGKDEKMSAQRKRNLRKLCYNIWEAPIDY